MAQTIDISFFSSTLFDEWKMAQTIDISLCMLALFGEQRNGSNNRYLLMYVHTF